MLPDNIVAVVMESEMMMKSASWGYTVDAIFKTRIWHNMSFDYESESDMLDGAIDALVKLLN